MVDLSRTVFAEATSPGRAALRVVRVSGEEAFPTLDSLFRPAEGGKPWETPRRMVLGRLGDGDGKILDEALVVCFPSPASLTGEDVVEFHCHGAPGIVRRLMELLARKGLRPALPGEFSYRAVVNAKMSLMQAEAVQALVASETGGQAEALAENVVGAMESRILLLREDLMALRARWEAGLDFPEDVPAETTVARIEALAPLISTLAGTVEREGPSALLREGWRVALVGPVNSGKSSLFNALLNRERALVTPHPGTTRDWLEETLDLGGFPMILRDTAGVRSSEDPVERAGVEQGLAAVQEVDGLIFVYDLAKEWGDEEEAVLERLGVPPLLCVANKCDLASGVPGRRGDDLVLSAKTGEGMERLSGRLRAWMEERAPEGGSFLYSQRQRDCARRALEGCLRAREALERGWTEEVALQGLGEAQRALDDLLGGGSPEDLYDCIFSSFCIGK